MSAKIATDASFSNDVLSSTGFVLVYFSAPWCGPCRQFSPIVDEVAGEKSSEFVIYKMNIDENPETASSLGVRGIPALLLFKDGKQVANKVGSLQKDVFVDWIESEMR